VSWDPDELLADLRHQWSQEIVHGDVLPRLADLARVPERARNRFFDYVINILFDAVENYFDRDFASYLLDGNAALTRAMGALRSARQALAELDAQQREAFWWPIAEVESGIDRFCEWVGSTETARPRPRRQGRPTGAVKDSVFQVLVRELLQAAETAGGRLTLQKNANRGTLIDALNMLALHLPDGLVPAALPLSTLQRIKTAVAAEKSNRRQQAASRP
jgi:hypothetical protein